MKSRLSKEEALSFLLTHLVVEKQVNIDLNQFALFNLMNLAAEAEIRLSQEEGLIPHEVMEELANRYLETL